MQIKCPNCKKIFELDEALIPDDGRTLQCGSCNHTWFYEKNKKNKLKPKTLIEDEIKEIKIPIKKNNEDKIENKKINKNSTKTNYLKIFLVIIISFVALIILSDTFQTQISKIIPEFEIILNNLYESLKDISLFLEDLFK